MATTWRKWSFVVLAIGYVLTGFLHLLAAILLFFVYGAKTSLGSQPELLPIYGRLGAVGYAIFFATIPLDFIAALYLLRTRFRVGIVTVITAVFNLPLVPLGTLVGVGTLALMCVSGRNSVQSRPEH